MRLDMGQVFQQLGYRKAVRLGFPVRLSIAHPHQQGAENVGRRRHLVKSRKFQ
jgi:hypothetical protein